MRSTNSGWTTLSTERQLETELLCTQYRAFLDKAKTERECVSLIKEESARQGFTSVFSSDMSSLQPGDKLYAVWRNKNIALIVIGERPMTEGVNFIVSHLDSPRLDLKPSPLHEEEEFAMMRTHYYGGIKKYQWGARPLALHGVVYTKQQQCLTISIGENPQQPVFTVPDLLPHLDSKIQRKRPSEEILKGEELQIIVGSIPATLDDPECKTRVKQQVLNQLREQYGIEENDFIRAELTLVPAGQAREVGLDGGLIGAYGQDDRICAFTSWQALMQTVTPPARTSICLMLDKEETGSCGSTGAQSDYLEYLIATLLSCQASPDFLQVKTCLMNSYALSADVVAGINPLFSKVHDIQNAARLGWGLVLTKYTGRGGKVETNDADAEYLAELTALFDRREIHWQSGLLGKVDEGGGGTIAKFLAQKGINTIDSGAPLLSMHSPFEISAKFDVGELYRGYHAFFAHDFPDMTQLYQTA